MKARFPLAVLGLALSGFPHLFAASNSFTTLTINPPVTNNNSLNFGTSVAALGGDRLLVFALGAATTYLFNTNGTLLTSFPGVWAAMSVLGNDRVVCGSIGTSFGGFNSAGAVHLFDTNGTLVNTISNPAPFHFDYFGWSVAAVGNDRVIVGALQDDTGATDTGAAYLFSTNGTLLTTFTNPTPANTDYFGWRVAALGNDRVLIGVPNDDLGAGDAGVAYLYSTSGALLYTFTNPTPANTGQFGYSIATLGNDKVLIAAPRGDIGAIDAGQVYLFTTNGILITSFTNPTPATSDYFGWDVAAMGNDRVLISTYLDDTGATDTGAAYLFSTNGTLLNTFTNPAAKDNGQFGYSVAGVGENRVLVGARYNGGTQFTTPGLAYLFTLETPVGPALSVQRVAGGNVRVFWPMPADGFLLDETSALASSPAAISWTLVPVASYQTNATHISVTSTPAGNKFYRLRKP